MALKARLGHFLRNELHVVDRRSFAKELPPEQRTHANDKRYAEQEQWQPGVLLIPAKSKDTPNESDDHGKQSGSLTDIRAHRHMISLRKPACSPSSSLSSAVNLAPSPISA